MTKETRTYKNRTRARACENFGAVDYTTTEIVTVVDGGLRVDTHVSGIADGERFEQKASNFYEGVSLEAAHAYRLRVGYSVVS